MIPDLEDNNIIEEIQEEPEKFDVDIDIGKLNKDCLDDVEKIEKNISIITVRQQEIQKFITILNEGIENLETIISRDSTSGTPNYDRIKACRAAITKNVEQIAELYNVYRAFEDTKVRYISGQSDNKYRYNRLINIDVTKLKMDSLGDNTKFTEMLASLSERISKNNLLDNEDLSLDEYES